ncbi:CoA ester lyase [Ochrobactrum pecoris]|uniref:Citrate lyase subunit beta/citryl-CoA lyase n=1 Tax=Brucella pecoris TaxID=867683 RepID=A0A5C5CEW0_9HYPH|nr:CoA ester lyase [Brucella pecoris]MBB4095633.1 citrate lyase subunit beta/citryl-CoA lyase [Brucella pecoris]NKW81841.1 CoA ester lyase [Brucella pecoris]TNV09658.1 CoA ester lyase [Brucella pecoris]
MRSLLFVPGNSIRKYEKARGSDADALILDLEDSVAQEAKIAARQTVGHMLRTPATPQKRFVRVNALDTGTTLDDLASILPLAPDGIVLPKCRSGADIHTLSLWLDGLEAANGQRPGFTRIIAIATETPESLFGLGTYRDAGPRLLGLMWGAEDLAACLGAHANSRAGIYEEPFRLARNLCLMGAAASGVMAIDAVCTDIRNLDHVAAEAVSASRDGFSAKAIIHPSHIEVVNQAFLPREEEIARARRIVSAIEASPDRGTVNLDGQMIDRPHEKAARKIVAAAEQYGKL